jgi:hypothetical protein
MLAVPGVMPDARPLVRSMVAMPVASLVQVPPAALLLRVLVLPTQIAAEPVIKPGSGVTVTVWVRRQPALVVYDTIEVPATLPVNVPVVGLMVPAITGLLLQVPPVVVVLSVVL